MLWTPFFPHVANESEARRLAAKAVLDGAWAHEGDVATAAKALRLKITVWRSDTPPTTYKPQVEGSERAHMHVLYTPLANNPEKGHFDLLVRTTADRLLVANGSTPSPLSMQQQRPPHQPQQQQNKGSPIASAIPACGFAIGETLR